jgi:hypothetical protein
VDAKLYDEAIRRYTDGVSVRAAAVYQVGSVRFPGLSDIDMVVVVARPAWDNNQYFSPFLRLPRRLHFLFHHGPRIVPLLSIDAVDVSSCGHAPSSYGTGSAVDRFGSRRRLLLGTDVLGDRTPLGADDAWPKCRVLETAILFRAAVDDIRHAWSADVTRLVSRAAALRHPKRHLDDLLHSERDRHYEQSVDECRAMLMDEAATPAHRETVAQRILDLFIEQVERFEAGVRTVFGLEADADTVAAAREMLSGRMPIPGVDPSYVGRRHESMRAYHRAMRDFGFSYGSIFALKPYDGAYPMYRQSAFQHAVASAAYRLRAG